MVGSFGDMAYQVFMVTKKNGGGFNGGITVTCNAIFKICNCNQV